MDIKFIEAAIEALLFSSGEPVSAEKISQVLEVDKATVVKIINNMSEQRNARNSGIQIIRLDGSFQMTAKPEFAPYIRKILDMRRNTPLSQAAMEALAIVAYNQPVTKGYIEQVRGVDCSSIIGSLVSKNLIEERGRMDVPGKPIIYGTTLEFLKCFGLSSLKDLPEPPSEQDGQPEAEPAEK